MNKREFYLEQQKRIADFARDVHEGKIVNEHGEKFTAVVQIGIGGSDLGPRAMYLALQNWAKANKQDYMDAAFISNVDPDDAASVLASVDVAHAIFILVSKSGTTLETLTNETFVQNALRAQGLDPARHMIAQHRRLPLFLYIGSRRCCAVPGLRTGSFLGISEWRGGRRPACKGSGSAEKSGHAGCPDRCL